MDDAASPALNPVLRNDHDRAPSLVVWEMTRACDLACLQCRADARLHRTAWEVSTLEAMALMNRVRMFGRLHFVLTGGDPAKRPDLVDLVRHGARIGLRMGVAPSGTPLVTPALMAELGEAGLSRVAVGLDGSTAELHDRFRGVRGSFAWTVGILRAAGEARLATQVHTTAARQTLEDLDGLAALMRKMEVVLWSLSFPVATGRTRPDGVASPEAFEGAFHRMYDLSRTAPFDIESTAAPHYRRVVRQRRAAERRATGDGATQAPAEGLDVGLLDRAGPACGVNDGNGFLFVGHTGEIYPSGFLPLSAGSVRTHDIVEVYRRSELFRTLRDPDRLKGKCGVCEFRAVCGGSRARAYALTGDPLEAEPFCVHVPARWAGKVDRGKAVSADAEAEARSPGAVG